MKLFYNALFYTMDSAGEKGIGLLVDTNGIIRQVIFSADEIRSLSGQGIERCDLNGRYVYPGFIDTHTHSFEGGLYSKAVNLEDVGSIGEMFALLSEARSPIVIGYHLDENQLREKRFPTIKELDRHFPGQPCIIRRIDGHSSLINSAAVRAIGLQDRLPSSFNGLLRAELNDYVSGWYHKNVPDDEIIETYVKASKIAAANGHTCVHTMVGDGANDLMHYNLIDKVTKDKPHLFAVEYILYPQIFNINNIVNISQQRWGRVGGCILADGSFGSGTAALTRPYTNNKDNKGILYKSDAEWYRFVKTAHENNLQVAVHCIGDRAVNQIVDIYCRVQQENPKNLKHQVIHCELLPEDDVIKKMADNNIAAVMQPVFDKLWGGDDKLYSRVIGADRSAKCNRLKSLVEAGVLVTGGSDWYVTDIDALAGIDAAVNIHNSDERLSPYKALELYTSNPARLVGKENVYGKLKAGLRADFVCLGHDILDDNNISSIPVEAVYKQGVRTFERSLS